MVEAAREVIAIVDSTKWGRAAFASFCGIDDLTAVVTDDGAPDGDGRRRCGQAACRRLDRSTDRAGSDDRVRTSRPGRPGRPPGRRGPTRGRRPGWASVGRDRRREDDARRPDRGGRAEEARRKEASHAIDRDQAGRRAARPGSPRVVGMLAEVSAERRRAPSRRQRRPSPRRPKPAPARPRSVTLTYLVDDTEATQARAKALDRGLHGAPPERDVRDRDATRWHGRRQHRQDPARHRRDDRHLLVQLRARCCRRSTRPRRWSTCPASRGSRTSPSPTSRRCRPVTRSSAPRARPRWAAASSTTRRSTPTSASASRRPGPSSRPTTRRSRPPASRRSPRRSATRGRRSCSSWRTTTTSRRRCPTSPRSTRSTRPTTPTRRPPWPASSASRRPSTRAGGRKDFARDQARRRPRSRRDGTVAHYPMLTFVARHDRRELPGPGQRRRLLRPAR